MDCQHLRDLFDFSVDDVQLDDHSKILVLRNFSLIDLNNCLFNKLQALIMSINVPSAPIQRLYYLETLANIFGKSILGEVEGFLENIKEGEYDPWTKVVSLTCIARILLKMDNVEKSESLLIEAEKKLKEILDNSDRSDAQKRIAILYAEMNKIDDAKKLLSKINYEKRKIEAILSIINILLDKGFENELDEFIRLLPPDWKIVSMAALANHSFVSKKRDQALSMVKRIVNSFSLIRDQEAKIEAIRRILPIILEIEGIREAEKVLSHGIGNGLLDSDLTRLIDWKSVKRLSPSKILTLEIIVMDRKTSHIREDVDKDITLLFLDLLGGKEIKGRIDSLKEKLSKLSENERSYFAIKISNILVEIFERKSLC